MGFVRVSLLNADVKAVPIAAWSRYLAGFDSRFLHEVNLMFGDLTKKYDELAGNTSDSLPDYAVPPSTHHLFDQYTSIPKTRNPKEAFYQGALSVLRLLGQNETATREEVEKLARDMTHEARHFLSHMNKE
jgi:hypothetical protein